MTQDAARSVRMEAYKREIARLDRRILPLRVMSNRVSWARVAAFLGAFAAALGVGSINYIGGWLALIVGLVLFVLVVAYHRHLEYWLRVFTFSSRIKSDQLARMSLHWDDLPAPLTVRAANTLSIDLDLTGYRSLHHLVDTTISRPGSQLVADWLATADPQIASIRARQALVQQLVPLVRFRDRFQLNFRLVLQERLEGEDLLRWLAASAPPARLGRRLLAASIFVILNISLFLLYLAGRLPPFWIVSVLGYFVYYFLNQAPLGEAFSGLVRLDAELDRFSALVHYLERSRFIKTPPLASLCAPFIDRSHSPTDYIRKVKLATAGVGVRSNPMLALLVNLILPWDFLFALFADRLRMQLKGVFPTWVSVVYELDALIALANFAYLNPEYTFPEIDPAAKPIFEARRLGHPLIPHEHKITNDFVVESTGRVAIITGSNMAGKSTFLKTVGINFCLAYAGAPVDATSLRSVPFRLHTCIRISDSIVDGFSYFYAEVKCLKRLLERLESPGGLAVFYLIDEIFRGTNNRERLLGSRAYIQALLTKNGVGLIATHDLELASLADTSPHVRNYHFRDRVQEGALVFDYQLYPGPCPTTNALKIMKLEGLPIEPS